MDSSGVSGVGGGFEATSAPKISSISRSLYIFMGRDSLKETISEMPPVVKGDEVVWFEGGNLEGWVFRAKKFVVSASIYRGREAL